MSMLQRVTTHHVLATCCDATRGARKAQLKWKPGAKLDLNLVPWSFCCGTGSPFFLPHLPLLRASDTFVFSQLSIRLGCFPKHHSSLPDICCVPSRHTLTLANCTWTLLLSVIVATSVFSFLQLLLRLTAIDPKLGFESFSECKNCSKCFKVTAVALPSHCRPVEKKFLVAYILPASVP
ncbi:hypothetical protein EV426DRAFT_80376 [Tirmania nivea]|nr:hypothetical protein EV426DRAFT_80376 [Tirmania nivea]